MPALLVANLSIAARAGERRRTAQLGSGSTALTPRRSRFRGGGRVRLNVGVRRRERRQRRAGRLDLQQLRERRQIDVEPAPRVELRDQVEVGDRRQRRRPGRSRPSRRRSPRWRRGRARCGGARAPSARRDRSRCRRCKNERFCIGWIPAFTISASWRARARSQGSAGSNGGDGNRSSRYSRIAIDWVSVRGGPGGSSITSTGTWDIGLSARNSALCWAPRVGRQVDRAPLDGDLLDVERDPHPPGGARAPVVVEDQPLTTRCGDAPEEIAPAGVGHLDGDGVAGGQVGRDRRAAGDGLSRAQLDEAGDAARRIGVGDGAAPQDRPRAEAARVRGVRDEIEERKVHLGAGVGIADQVRGAARPLERRAERQVDAPVAPGAPQLVGRHRERRERRRRLGLEEPEPLGQLAGDQVPQRDVVGEQQQANVGGRLRRRSFRAARRPGSPPPRSRSRAPTRHRRGSRSSRGPSRTPEPPW